jgi:hypothetical protein
LNHFLMEECKPIQSQNEITKECEWKWLIKGISIYINKQLGPWCMPCCAHNLTWHTQ